MDDYTELIERLLNDGATNPHAARSAAFILLEWPEGEYRAQLAQACRASFVTGDWGPVTRLIYAPPAGEIDF